MAIAAPKKPSDNPNNINTLKMRPAIHPTYARLLCAKLRQLGFDNATIFAGTHLQWEQLLGDNQFISFEQIRRLILRAVEITEQPWIGLSVGGITQASAHGALGYGAVAADNVGAALTLVARLVSLRQQIIDFDVVIEDDRCKVVMTDHFDFGDVRHFIHDLLVATLVMVAESVSGLPLDQGVIHLPMAKPDWDIEYHRSFPHQEIVFDSPQLAVEFPLAYLELPSLMADPNAFRQAEQECERLLKLQASGGDLAQRIRNLFLDHGAPYPALDSLAEQLHMSKRTLIRKLKQQHTSYQELLDDVRKELAAWYLIHTDDSVESIAETLGYIDTTNFSRTFRRWFAMTAREFRNLRQ